MKSSSRNLALVVAACALAAVGMQARADNDKDKGNQNQNPGKAANFRVVPPPLPLGSKMVKLQGGLDDNEIKRESRAHSNKNVKSRDPNRDDSVSTGTGAGKGNK